MGWPANLKREENFDLFNRISFMDDRTPVEVAEWIYDELLDVDSMFKV